MGRMAAPRRTASCVVVLAIVTVVLGGCTEETPPDEPVPSSVALGVETISGAEGLDDTTRTALETAVGDVLSGYVSRAFLGDFPREEFVPAFESFTSGAARRAAQDIDRLTASPVQDATAVRATQLDARLSFLVQGERPLGATATVNFDFEATMADGTVRPLSLQGRLMLDQRGGAWSVFGYDVALDDGAAIATELSP